MSPSLMFGGFFFFLQLKNRQFKGSKGGDNRSERALMSGAVALHGVWVGNVRDRVFYS